MRVKKRKPAESKATLIQVPKRGLAKAKAQSKDFTQIVLGGGETTAELDDGVIPHPLPFDALNRVFEKSNSLRQNVDAYATNIDGHGHSYQPIVDLEADDTKLKVKSIIQMEQQVVTGDVDVPDPTDEEIQKRIDKFADAQRKELLTLETNFEYIADGMSYTRLRKIGRQDHEVTGNKYVEVRRDAKRRPRQFTHLESHTMYLTPLDDEETECQEYRRTPTQNLELTTVMRRFRRYQQRIGNKRVWFKQYGDPRVVSSKTGKYYDSVEAMQAADGEEGARPATEVLHDFVYSALSPYGIPRWVGALLSVLGSRSSEEVNYDYFENKSVPPLAVLVSNGSLSKDAIGKIEQFFNTAIKGKSNFHKVLIIEASGSEGNALENGGQAKVELKPLTEAQNADALFQKYDERNIDKVGMTFRVPRMLRGDTRDFNRSTAYAAIDMAERQVFNPERTEYDYGINRYILPDMGISQWRIKSNGPQQQDPESLSKMIHDLQDIFGINTLMELAQPVFGRNFSRVREPWADKPLKLVLAEMQQQAAMAKLTMQGQDLGENTGAADDANPDNQDSGVGGVEAQQSRSEVSDNKSNRRQASKDPRKTQPRDLGGRFGNSNAPKRPTKPRAK